MTAVASEPAASAGSTADPPPMTFTVDPWDPGYGQAFGEEMDPAGSGALSESSAVLDLDFEVPAGDWRPIDPDPDVAVPQAVLFIDGVRRIDARVWVHGGGLQPVAGIAASLAAGLVVCNGLAHVADVVVERGLFTAAGDMGDLVTRAGRYVAQAAEGAGLDKLSLALQQRLAFAELQLAVAFRAAHPGDDDLLVVDGPLRGRTHLDRTVGYIKTHHASYLPGPQAAVVGALKPGQRTPAFTMGTSWQRNSWYLQLPGTDGVPWSGVVRLECSADLEPKDVTRLADLTARVLPPLASVPHKDPRAPQNLVPIGGLERQLKHRLGDERLLYRALRAASMGAAPDHQALWSASEYATYLTYVTMKDDGRGLQEADVAGIHYDSYSEARSHLKDLLDAAEQGRLATVRRESMSAAVVDAGRLRHFLASVVPSRAQVVAEAGGWSAFIPGLPVTADGATFDAAIDEMVQALREYAQDWQDRLLEAPNHRDNWGLVQLICLSDDDQLRRWLTGAS